MEFGKLAFFGLWQEQPLDASGQNTGTAEGSEKVSWATHGFGGKVGFGWFWEDMNFDHPLTNIIL